MTTATLTEPDILRHRRKIALEIATFLSHHFPGLEHRTSGYDVDEAAAHIAGFIPLTAAQAGAEMDALREEFRNATDAPPKPSPLAPLRDAIGMQKGNIVDVLKTAVEIIADLRSQRDELLAVLERLSEAIHGLIMSSEGVAGLHGNGDVATWDELCIGGRFEEWLLPWSEALEVIAKARASQPGA